MSQTFQVIQGAADIDLNRHAVIEASAGTGKTYTMVELVMRLMADEQSGLPLDKILLTTFTDNAANELKTRIRTQIINRLSTGNLSEVLIKRFNKALQNIESAPIYTIHGFCQRMAGEYAFESGEVFDRELVDSDRIREDRFHAFVRTWPAHQLLKTAFQDYLTASHTNSLSRLKSTVLEVARQSNPDFDVIFPPEPETPLPDLAGFTLLDEINSLESQFLKLHTNKGGALNNAIQKNWNEKVKPLFLVLTDGSLSSDAKYTYLTEKVIKPMADKSNLEYFFLGAPKAFKSGQWQENKNKLPLICAQLEAIFELINHRKAHQNFKKTAIIKYSLDYLDKDITDYLSAQGQVTFDRIIRNLFTLLQSEQQSSQALLTEAIRKQFSVVMIDEFQDTDPYQWHIFKWLFLDSHNSQHRLWVIGDPKQAIYGFRGADVNTYINARSEILKAGANSYRLNTNYRSITPLIKAYNQFFTARKTPENPGFWYPADSIQVAAADRQKNPQLPQLVADNSGLSAFNYIPLDEDNNADARRIELADLIAEIIETRLVGRLEYTSGGDSKILNYDDICVLIRANKDSDIIKQACLKRHIPVSIQRSQGLYKQTEAIAFEIILSAFHQPQDSRRVHNALSSVFFNHAFEDVAGLCEQQQQDVHQQWQQLLAQAKAGEWVAVFDWLIEGSGTRMRAEINGNRRQLANLQTIANTLCRYAMQNHVGCAELLRYYKKLRLTAHEQDQDHQHQDTDHQAVKVMTMHGAKGLEFPVVFVFDGLTAPRDSKPYHKFYSEAHQATVYDVSKQSAECQKATNRKEFKQLYYVAITRAVYKVFLPFTDSEKSHLSKEFQQLVSANIQHCQTMDLDQSCRPISTASADAAGEGLLTPPIKQSDCLPFVASPFNVVSRRQLRHSFSSLAHRQSSQLNSDQRHYGEQTGEHDEPLSEDTVITETPLIPGGVTTGHVLHGLFEHVDFNAITRHKQLSDLWQDEVVMTEVDRQMQLFNMRNQLISAAHEARTDAADYRQQLAAWVWHTLKKPLPMLDGQSLGMISPDDRRHEMSFQWQHQSQTLTGFIDLLFRIRNRQGGDDYYILDWKSNLSAEGYAPEILAKTVMKQHHYDLQYQLYAAAVAAWFEHLKLPKARLKGAIYVFSRGIDCQRDDLQGIFYHAFTDLQEQNKHTGAQLSRLMRGQP